MEGIIEIPSPFPIGLADWNVGASVELRTLFRRFLRLNSHRHLLILRLFAFLRELEYGETLDWRLSVLQEITMHLLWHFSCLQKCPLARSLRLKHPRLSFRRGNYLFTLWSLDEIYE